MTLTNLGPELTDKKTILECLAVIKELHPGWKVENMELVINLWHGKLKYYQANEIKRVVYDLASSSKYVPKLADVLEALEKQSNSVKIEYHDDVQELQNYMDSLGNEELKQFHRNVENYIQDNSYGLDQFEMRYAKLYLETKQKLDEITGRE